MLFRSIPTSAHGVKCLSMGYFVPDDQPVIWRGPMLHKAIQQFLSILCFLDKFYGAVRAQGENNSLAEYFVVIGDSNFNYSHRLLFGRARQCNVTLTHSIYYRA